MGGMTSSQTTSTPTMPGYVKGLYKDIYKDVNQFYNKGKMPVFSEPTTAALTDQQNTALTGMMGTANANSGENGMAPHLQSIMSSGGFNQGQLDSINSIKGLSNNTNLNNLINDPNGMTQAQNQAYSGLQNTVYGNNANLQGTFNQGGLTGDQQDVMNFYRNGMNEQFGLDPAYQRVKQQALNTQGDALSARAAAAGRYGGGMDQAILAREQGNLSDRMDTTELDKWRARTNTAAGNRAGLAQQGLGNQLGINSAQQTGLQGIGTMGNMGVTQQNTAIGTKSGLESQLFNMNQAGLDNMGKAYDTALKPSQTQMGVGNIYQQQAQNVINDKMRMFDAQNPMNAYQQFLGLASGMPTGTTQTTTPSTLQMLLGGGLGTMGLLGGLGMF
jgi:hypothetical protein